ncbi:Asp-tRNA(Asn)/Glu-tRNA(Gln) amidotransferase A subunit family amidase [Sulfuritortus calidifontis]|uniref:Asp-tRNA(Asn)/Glu-tRNA(Gln) amidotransferase A subunit family amidase n=1 Tax=Sulfuritortus calidifontis TaxID=1914471 RepID=A0A4R3JWT3_9PROT|nr:amidase [Sulfuritortus calidifontis]TCS71692.1 Asp-tRNA(Asn)/Glu-tRNA(Gln) amidotransferase A subunit family amidase [Sulfuritortus calidifontis]
MTLATDSSLRALVAGLHQGDLSSAALTEACLARLAEREAEIGAWAWCDPEAARAKARAADAVPAKGLLHGIPVGIKDIMHTAGIPTGMGSPIFDGFVPETSAEVVARIEAAGGFVLGKTVTAELAYYTPGKTRNPWHLAHTPGGSSSGSAAAVAAGMVPAALGSQTNGSVIRPAAYCGVVGFKPSAGNVPTRGILRFSGTLDQVGLFVREVTDAGLLGAVLSEADALAEVVPPARPPRLRAVRSPAWPEAEPAQRQMFEANLAALRAAGAEVVEQELPAVFDDAHAVHRTIMAFEAAKQMVPLYVEHAQQMSLPLRQIIAEGLAIETADYRAALARRLDLRLALAEWLGEADAIVTPPAAGEAPATLTHTGSPAFCTIWSLTGVPALTFPVGLGPRGLPLGLQLVGGLNEDAALLASATWCAERIGFSGQPA